MHRAFVGGATMAPAPFPTLAPPGSAAPPPLPRRPDPPPDSLVWPRAAQWAAAFLLGIVLTLLAVHAIATLRLGTRPTERESATVLSYRVDLNQATRAELLQLPGVGPALADRIDAYRCQHGFRSVDDLLKVPGVGPARLERIRSWVCIAEDGSVDDDLRETFHTVWKPAEPASAPLPIRTRRPASKEELALVGVTIDINQAEAAELERLPGIGKVLSQRIVAERQIARFDTVDDLRRVKGIGPKTLEKVRPYVTVGDTHFAP